ncbi:MAG TPA: DsbA family protein [Nocardioidaceae bacterium]|nr:DsbA family protein [Nocardioidaceae bacterium]
MSNRKKRDERQTRAAQMRRDRERASARRTRLVTGSIVAAVVVLVVAAGVAIFASQRDTGQRPDGVTSDNGYLVTADGLESDEASDALTPVKVVFYEDFQCPICRQFESAVAGYVDQQLKFNAITVEYRPIAILNRFSTTEYSTRSAAAAACVFDDAGIEAFYKYHAQLFQNQPEENSPGLSDSELSTLAEQVGADSASSCIEGDDYEGWVSEATDQASQDNVNGTPTVLVDGKEVTDGKGGPPHLEDLIDAVFAATPSSTESPQSPAGSPSATSESPSRE